MMIFSKVPMQVRTQRGIDSGASPCETSYRSVLTERLNGRPQVVFCKRVAALLGGLVVTAAACAQTPTTEVAVPDDVDPNDNSGWLKIELAVLIDDREEILGGEFWPPFPEPRYPSTHRWLLDPGRVKALGDLYPMAEATQDDNGAITISLPDPLSIVAEARAELEAEQAAALAAEAGVAGMADMESDLATDSETATDEESIGPDPVPLELIDAKPESTRASVDWLQDFEDQKQQADTLDEGKAALESIDATYEQAEEIPVYTLPSAFMTQPVEMLQPGLRALVRSNPDRVELSTSWLQPPNAANLPIVLDTSGDTDDWPPLQGFVELRWGNPMRMGVNFWWNTDASYYPETYSMNPPPRGPAQVTLIDQLDDRELSETEAAERSDQLAELKAAQDANKPIVEYVDPDTGFFVRNETQELSLAANPEDQRQWPWRHVIQVADTRTLPEGSVRYFDHPVVKVVATWRELTWGEVYLLGEEERKAREFDAAIEDAENNPSQPASIIPPGDPALR